MSEPKPSLLRVLFLTARPKTLGASIAPVLIGSALAFHDHKFHLPSALCALIGALLIQILTNYANDYFDYFKGADQTNRLGPPRATSAGWLTPAQMRWALVILVIVSLIPGGYLIYRGGLPIFLIGLLSLLLAFAYTAGPIPLAYLGLGDIFVFIFFGPVAVLGTYYVQSLEYSFEGLLGGIAPGCLSVAILTVNNYRDIDNDRLVGKRTLAVRFGKKFAQFEYIIMIFISTVVVPILLAWQNTSQMDILLLMILAIPAMFLSHSFTRLVGRDLNPLLAKTSALLLVYSLLFTLLWGFHG